MIPFVTIILICIVGQGRGEKEETLQEMMKRYQPLIMGHIEETNTIGYMEPCDYDAEIDRKERSQEVFRLSMKAALATDDMERDITQWTLDDKLNETIFTYGPYCDGRRMLECNDLKKCVCSNVEIGGMVLKSERDGDHCDLAEGSTCVPEELVREMLEKDPNMAGSGGGRFKCAFSRDCVIKRDKTRCTKDKYGKEFQQMIENEVSRYVDRGEQITTQTGAAIGLKIVKEGVCICGKAVPESSLASPFPPPTFIVLSLTLIGIGLAN